MADNAYPYDTSLVRELLKNKRKVRGIRSCFPCRHRKVRCDGHVPCASCVKRNHPELCRVPTSRTEEQAENSSPASSAQQNSELNLDAINQTIEETRTQPSTDPDLLISRLEKIEEQISSIKADLRATSTSTAQSPQLESEASHPNPSQKHTRPTSKSPGRYYVEDSTGATIYLGSHSDTPLALGCRQASATGDLMLHDAMVDQFVPRAYPFTSLWGPEATAGDVCDTLPDDSDLIRYWQTYQSIAFPFYPVLVTLDQFAPALFAFIDQRAASRDRLSRAEEPNPSWLALLFAVLACGVQFSNDQIKDRDLRSKVFICSSFHCLRMSNFFNHADLDQVQAMALIGHCLRNNLDTNSAWVLMGATIRLAQSIGLHEPSLSLPPSDYSQRNRLWWMLIWQDTFLSFTYDRPPSSIPMNCPIPYASNTKGISFQESIFTICNIILDRAQQEASGNIKNSMHSVLEYKRRLEAVSDAAMPFLTDKTKCTMLQDHLERLALGVHLGYAICRLCRVYLDGTESNSPVPTSAASDCVQRATQVIENFLDLHRYSASVCRSWAFVHNAVSCAITLKSLGHIHPDDQKPKILTQRLIEVLRKEETESKWCDADTNVRYFGPYSRALKALREIYRDTDA